MALMWANGSPAAEDCTIFVRDGLVPVGTADGKTPSTAFATLAAGARAIHNPGDVLCVGPGDYPEGNIEVPADGAPGEPESGNASPVIIRGDASGASTGDPPGPVVLLAPGGDGAALITTGFLIRGRQYVTIEGFKIRNFGDAGIQVRAAVDGTNSANVTIRDNEITGCRTGIDVLAQDMVVIEGNRTVGNHGPGISVRRCLVTTENGRCRIGQFKPVIPVISNNRSGGNDAHGIFIQAADNAVLQNNIIFSNGIDGVTGAGITLRESNDTLIANNLVYGNREQGIVIGKQDLASPGTIVLNNSIYANGDWGIELGSVGAGSPRGTVVNNIVWRNHEGAEDGTRGIGVLNENSGTTPVRPASTCGYSAGFNIVLDQYGPETPFNVYDRHDDPLLVSPAGRDGILGGVRVGGEFVDRSGDDDFHLQQLAGQALSPAVDHGSAEAAQIQLSGSTAADGRPDTGIVDIGFHYGADAEHVLAVPAPYMPLFVRRSGSSRDSNDGLTPNTAKLTIAAAAQEARAGITVVVGPGRYQECEIAIPANRGKAAFFADVTGERSGDTPRPVFVDAQQCVFNDETSLFEPGDTGFDFSSSCDVVIDGFHVTGAKEDGIRIDSNSDRAVVRNNVVFSVGDPAKRTGRAIRIVDSNDVRIVNNLVFGNMAGIALGGSQSAESPGSRRATIEFNTAYDNFFNGIQVGDIGASSSATVRYNVTGANGKNGIEVGNDETREANLFGFVNAYNLVADGYASGVPRAASDLVDLDDEPLYLDPNIDPSEISAGVDWLNDQHFRLVQSGGHWSRAVDYANITAAKAGVADRSTRSDGGADAGPADLGYHYPRRAHVPGDCDGDGRVVVNELVMSVNIALDQAPMSACAAVDLNADGHATVNELIAAVGSALE